MVESFICTKSSKKWAKPGPFTPKMALIKDYTSVLNIMKLKLVKSANKTQKKSSKGKKILSKFIKI